MPLFFLAHAADRFHQTYTALQTWAFSIKSVLSFSYRAFSRKSLLIRVCVSVRTSHRRPARTPPNRRRVIQTNAPHSSRFSGSAAPLRLLHRLSRTSCSTAAESGSCSLRRMLLASRIQSATPSAERHSRIAWPMVVGSGLVRAATVVG